jgi:HPt (histidine-containing phosphotransfer) domain-containing protein
VNQTAEKILHEQLKVLRVKFIDILEDHVDALEVLLEKVDLKDERLQALQQAQFITHKVSGTAGTLGLTELGRLAAETENTIIQHLSAKKSRPTLEDTKLVINNFIESADDL